MPRESKTRRFYKKGKARKKAGSKSLSLFILVLGLAVLVYTFSFVKRLTQTEAVGSPEPISVRMDILNGCGVRGAAGDVRNYLLENEFEGLIFDVIEVANFTDTGVPYTLVWDRVGDQSTAQRVAQVLGIEKRFVSEEPLRDNYLDTKITLILGQDYQKIFRKEKP